MSDLSYIEKNADALIVMGKKAWLKQRRASHKAEMTEEQQEWEVTLIEKRRNEKTVNE